MARYETLTDWHLANPEPEMVFHHCPHCTEWVERDRTCAICGHDMECGRCGSTLETGKHYTFPKCPDRCA